MSFIGKSVSRGLLIFLLGLWSIGCGGQEDPTQAGPGGQMGKADDTNAVGAVFSLINGDFSDSLVGWKKKTTDNGSFGVDESQLIQEFDTVAMGELSPCVRLSVGQLEPEGFPNGLDNPGSQKGVLLWQTVNFPEVSQITLSVDLAASYEGTTAWVRNAFGGRFALVLLDDEDMSPDGTFFDGKEVAVHNMGPIEAKETKRYTLTVDLDLPAGPHTIGLKITRPARNGKNGPYQYVDNFFLTSPNSSTLPEEDNTLPKEDNTLPEEDNTLPEDGATPPESDPPPTF